MATKQNKQTIYQKFKAKLMNNTKWREVFVCLAEHETSFYLSFVEDPNKKTELHSVYPYIIEERGIGDNGIGPFEYKEIYSLNIPKIKRFPKKMRDGVYIYSYKETQQETVELLKSLHLLGQLPLFETDEFIEINGYI